MVVIKDVTELNVDEILELVKEYHGTGIWGVKGDLLERLAELLNEDVSISKLHIDQLKKQIKYSKNPLEIKKLNKELNSLYKLRK